MKLKAVGMEAMTERITPVLLSCKNDLPQTSLSISCTYSKDNRFFFCHANGSFVFPLPSDHCELCLIWIQILRDRFIRCRQVGWFTWGLVYLFKFVLLYLIKLNYTLKNNQNQSLKHEYLISVQSFMSLMHVFETYSSSSDRLVDVTEGLPYLS